MYEGKHGKRTLAYIIVLIMVFSLAPIITPSANAEQKYTSYIAPNGPTLQIGIGGGSSRVEPDLTSSNNTYYAEWSDLYAWEDGKIDINSGYNMLGAHTVVLYENLGDTEFRVNDMQIQMYRWGFDNATYPDNMNKSLWYYQAIQEAVNSHEYELSDRGTESWTVLLTPPDWAEMEMALVSSIP